MHVFALDRQGGALTLLRNSDHLLRRFGRLDVLDLAAGEQAPLSVRGEADRFLFPIGGEVSIAMLDLREQSPSRGANVDLTLSAEAPQGVLVPFGVALSMHAKAAARLIVLSTHSEEHPQDRAPAAEELAKFAGNQ